jgi:hypothetical protein
LSEDETWAAVAFVMQLPVLSAADYRALTAPGAETAR